MDLQLAAADLDTWTQHVCHMQQRADLCQTASREGIPHAAASPLKMGYLHTDPRYSCSLANFAGNEAFATPMASRSQATF